MHAEGAVKLRPGQDSRALVAQVGVARCAVATLPAAWNKAQHYMIAGFDAGDFGANLFDDAGSLMAQGHRQVGGQVADDNMIVGVADTGGDDAYLYLVVLRRIKLDLLNADGFAGGVNDACSCLHGYSSCLLTGNTTHNKLLAVWRICLVFAAHPLFKSVAASGGQS